jgi:2-phosphosulfolactate phosphatase
VKEQEPQFVPSDIQILDFVDGARRARGLTVVIDVFRAFSLAAHLFARGAARIFPVASIESPLPGFDAGNSPTELERFDVRGRTIIHTTHAGTQGLANATQATEVITGALVNAAAIVRYIRLQKAPVVSLVRMGHEATERCDEDDLCASVLAARLRGESVEVDPRSALRGASSAVKFFDPACTWAPEGDFKRCTRLDAFDFVLRLEADDPIARLRCIPVP